MIRCVCQHVSERALLAQIGQLYGKLGLVGRGTAMMEALLPLILAHIHDRYMTLTCHSFVQSLTTTRARR